MKKVHDNIYDTGKAFVVRFLRKGIKINKNFAYDPDHKPKKGQPSSREKALNAAIGYRVAEWEEITHKGQSVMNTTQLTLRPLIMRYLHEVTKGLEAGVPEKPEDVKRNAKDKTKGKKGKVEETYRINKIIRGIDEKKTLIDTPIQKLGKDDFKALAKYIAPQYTSGYSVNRMISVFSNVFKWAKEQDQYAWIENLAEGSSVKVHQERKRVPTADEIEQVLSYTQSPALKIAIVLGVETGARRGELCKVVWEDIKLESSDTKHPHIIFRDLKNGDFVKAVPLSKLAVKLLESIAPEKRQGFLFPSETEPDATIDPHSITTAFTRARKRAIEKNAALKDVRFHGARGRFITDKAMFVNPLDLAMLSGHKNVEVLRQHYYQPTPEDLAKKLKQGGWEKEKTAS